MNIVFVFGLGCFVYILGQALDKMLGLELRGNQLVVLVHRVLWTLIGVVVWEINGYFIG